MRVLLIRGEVPRPDQRRCRCRVWRESGFGARVRWESTSASAPYRNGSFRYEHVRRDSTRREADHYVTAFVTDGAWRWIYQPERLNLEDVRAFFFSAGRRPSKRVLLTAVLLAEPSEEIAFRDMAFTLRRLPGALSGAVDVITVCSPTYRDLRETTLVQLFIECACAHGIAEFSRTSLNYRSSLLFTALRVQGTLTAPVSELTHVLGLPYWWGFRHRYEDAFAARLKELRRNHAALLDELDALFGQHTPPSRDDDLEKSYELMRSYGERELDRRTRMARLWVPVLFAGIIWLFNNEYCTPPPAGASGPPVATKPVVSTTLRPPCADHVVHRTSPNEKL